MTRPIISSPHAPADSTAPVWWRVPDLWLVIALPAVAVVASIAMLFTAIGTPDPVLPTGEAARADASARPAPKTMLPALAGRNHAATPAPDLPAPRP